MFRVSHFLFTLQLHNRADSVRACFVFCARGIAGHAGAGAREREYGGGIAGIHNLYVYVNVNVCVSERERGRKREMERGGAGGGGGAREWEGRERRAGGSPSPCGAPRLAGRHGGAGQPAGREGAHRCTRKPRAPSDVL